MRITAEEFVASMPKRPAGWYEDPVRPSVMRWWDGEEWTTQTDEFFRPANVTAGGASRRPSWATTPEPTRAWHEGWGVRAAAVLALAATVAAAAMAAHQYVSLIG